MAVHPSEKKSAPLPPLFWALLWVALASIGGAAVGVGAWIAGRE